MLLLLKIQMVDEKNIAFVINMYRPMTMSASGVGQELVAICNVFVYEGEGKRGKRISAVVFVTRHLASMQRHHDPATGQDVQTV